MSALCGSALVPTTTRALTAPADTQGGTTTFNDVSASARTIRALDETKNTALPAATTLKNRALRRTPDSE